MSNVIINDTHLTNIANAIRSKNGKTTTYKPGDMAAAIQNISSGGATPEKGIVVNEYNAEGYATDISIVGFTQIPDYYLYYAFYYWTKGGKGAILSRVTTGLHIPDDVVLIGEYAFDNGRSLEIEELPDSITTIRDNAFGSCVSMPLKKFPKYLRTIGRSSFVNCPKIVCTEFSEGLTSIGDYCFSGCSELALNNLPKSLTSIGSSCFSNCKKITIKELHDTLQTISDGAFQGCISITEMTINHTAPKFYSNCFKNCTNLTKLVIPNITAAPYIANSNILQGTPIESGTGYIYVPDNLVDSFKSATNWSAYAEQIRPISSLNNILDLSQQQFPITTDGNMTIDYDTNSQTFTLNGTVEESHGFNIPITQELLGTYTLSYNNTETDRGFYISLDNKTETMLNGWGANTKTFTLTEQPSQLMFWFDHSDDTPERNVYTDYKINLVLVEGENE